MVGKVSQFQEQLSLKVQQTKARSLSLSSEGKNSTGISLSEISESSFSLDLSRSLKVVEGEARKNVVSAFDLEISLSVSASGKLESNLRKLSDQAEEASKSETSEAENPFSPENTAKRIVEFVRQAMGFARNSGKLDENSESALSRFAELQINSVKEGFKQARGILGKIPDEVSGGINNTYDLVMDGLDRLFHPEKYEDEENQAEKPVKDPANGSFYSSQSFSLSFQLSISAEGQFDPEELNSFIEDSFGKVQDAFSSFLEEGEGALGFNPMELFSKGEFKPEKMMSLLGAAA